MSDTSDSSVEPTTSYDTGYVESYEVTTTAAPYEQVPAFDPGVPVTETGSTSYDSTDYSVVAEVSEAHMADYQAAATVSNDLYQASVDAYLAGDDMAAYERYRAALRADEEGRANFAFAQTCRLILREERTWLEDVNGTRNVARQVTP